MPFCPRCGETIARGETFCEAHKPHALDVKPFEVRICSCGRYFSGNRWVTIQDLHASVAKTAKDHIKQRVETTIERLPLPEKRGQKTTGKITATYEGEAHTIEFPIKLQRCDKCDKLGTHYFTAILQLRNPPAGVLEYIENHLLPLAEKGVAINKVEDTPRGPDLYMTHKGAARQLAEKLVRKYGGAMKTSEQLFSHDKQTGKDLFRLNVLVQFATFAPGDAVLLNGHAVLITGTGKHCTGRDLCQDSKVVFTAGEEEKKLTVYKTTVSRTRPLVEVIHPITYSSTPVANHERLLPPLKDGQAVKVAIASKKLYII